jgi:hypothetical protein
MKCHFSKEKTLLSGQKSSGTSLEDFGGYNSQNKCGNTSRVIQKVPEILWPSQNV